MSASVAYAELGAVARPSLSADDRNLLRHARMLINAGWCRGALAKAEIRGRHFCLNERAEVEAVIAEQYSLIGALFRSARHDQPGTYCRLHDYLKGRLPHDRTSLDHMNDHPAMTKRELLDWLDDCISFAGL